MARVYLDANSTYSHPQLRAWMGTFPEVGNPSSLHEAGRRAKKILNSVRDQIANLTSADVHDVFFVSGASEGLTQLLQGLKKDKTIKRIGVLATDHTCVLENASKLSGLGFQVRKFPVCALGLPVLPDVPDIDVMVVTAVNNETGVFFPLRIVEKLKAQGVKILLDGVQVLGKCEHWQQYFELSDAIVLSSHKIGGLPGTGVVINKSLESEPLILGGKQERSRRGGTENVLGVYILGHVLENLPLFSLSKRLYLEDKLQKAFPQILIHGMGAERASNTVNFHIPGMKSTILMNLDQAGFSVSLGSACASGAIAGSHVIMAMTGQESIAEASIRASLCPETSCENLDLFISTLQVALN